MDNSNNKLTAYVGTYTRDGENNGIYTYNVDTATGEFKQLSEYNGIKNPSYLWISKDNKYLYSVIETSEFNGKYGGGVASFSIDSGKGTLEFINSQNTLGDSPCHVISDSKNKCLFVSNYGEGTITVFPINPNGSIDSHSYIIKHEGSGPNHTRQEKAHTHFSGLSPDEKYLYAIDLGIDKVLLYEFDNKNGKLIHEHKKFVSIQPGSGPRHMEFHPNGKFAYLINELSSTIMLLEYSNSDSIFAVKQCISSLPKDYNGISIGAAVHVSPDGNFLYASNRGHDSIVAYKIDSSSGELELVSHFSTLGNFPRDFAIDPTGKFLFVANQNSDTIVPFTIINNSGRLEQYGDFINVPSPVCIKLVPQY